MTPDTGTQAPKSGELLAGKSWTDTAPWWWSKDEERYSGPCRTRAEALVEAFSEGESAVHLIQAEHGGLSCGLYDASSLAEQFDECNYEDGDGDSDPPSEAIPDKEWEKIASILEGAVKSAARQAGVQPWRFSRQTAGEWVTLADPMIAALPDEARRIIAEIATSWSSEYPWCETYLNGEMERLRCALAQSPAEGSGR